MKKILVIEDEALIRLNILDCLENANFDAVGAENGSDGIELAGRYQPDLIICDIMMPDIDGYSVLTEVRQNIVTATTPFIFLSAKSEREDMRLGMEMGADDYITKPCTPTELLSAIAARLEKHNAYIQKSASERDRIRSLQKRVQELQQLSQTREELSKRLSEDLRDPMSNINMAIEMLKLAPSQQARDRYLKILQQECARELTILNQLCNWQEFLTPENVQLLHRLNISNGSNS
ncbi:response regulator [Kamptonema sp. UHCC 0994]|uniref:ATP-binding response regulator n=1 Tax=Kamptonema sp. UHCC 0994 TaxID=3031329 RepID=UPI0023B8C61C|nr:response regulator [Kamptonema sp. UHCC 0994]MDF0554604.1 response regulator [Kamptonema sp. UHCC 0994]